ncbi:MAG: response regulator [Polyangiaceae bacterium]
MHEESRGPAGLGPLAAGVGHEINNPAAYVLANLTAMGASLGALAAELHQRPELSSRVHDLYEMVQESLDGMERIRSTMHDLRALGERARNARGSERESMPTVSPPAHASGATLGSPLPRRGATEDALKLLLIDDEPLVLRSLKRMLSQHIVELASSGEQALARLDKDADYDLIVCDVMMPGMDGIDVHAEIALRFPHLLERMVFCSGGAFTPRSQAFVDGLEQPMVEKPVTLAAFSEVVRRFRPVTSAPSEESSRRAAS